MSVLEGSSNKRQRAWAWADPPHIVVGNPENLSRLVTTGAVRVNAVSYVVVDEVDACLLSEGTRSWLHELLARSLSPTHADEEDQEVSERAKERKSDPQTAVSWRQTALSLSCFTFSRTGWVQPLSAGDTRVGTR